MNFQAWFCSALEAGGEDGIFIKDSDSRRPVNISLVKKIKKKGQKKPPQLLLQADAEERSRDSALRASSCRVSAGIGAPGSSTASGPAGMESWGPWGEAGQVGCNTRSNGPVPAPCPFGAPCRREHAGLCCQDGLLPLRLRGVLPGPLPLHVAKQCAVTQTTGREEY